MNDMYYNPANFDFTSLVDVIETAPEEETQKTFASDMNSDGGIVTDATDLMGDEYEPEPEPTEEELQQGYNDNVSDLMNKEEDQREALQIFNDLDESQVLDFGGVTLTKSEVKELMNVKSDVETKRGYIDEVSRTFDEGTRYLQASQMRNQNVLERNIEILRSQLNNPNITPTEYGSVAKQLNTALEAHNKLNNDIEEQLRVRAGQEVEINRYRILKSNDEMKQIVPEWDRVGVAVFDDALARGMNPKALERIWDTPFAQMAYDAFKYRQSKARVANQAATAAKARVARSTSSATQIKRDANRDAGKEQARQQMRKGNFTSRNMSALYDALVD